MQFVKKFYEFNDFLDKSKLIEVANPENQLIAGKVKFKLS